MMHDGGDGVAASYPVDDDDDEDADEVLTRSNRPEEEMDMTPMVDVTFLLLIFFMVTAAFALQKSMPMPKQQSDEASASTIEQEEELQVVDLEVDERGMFMVFAPDWERETPGKNNLIIALRDAAAGSEEPMKLNVKYLEETKIKYVIDAMDAGTIAEYSPIETTQVNEFE